MKYVVQSRNGQRHPKFLARPTKKIIFGGIGDQEGQKEYHKDLANITQNHPSIFF